MAAKVLSIEIGNSVTRIIQMDQGKKNPKVYRHVTVPTPEGSIADGYLSGDTSALRGVITSAIELNQMKDSKKVIFTIASSKILTREVILPGVKENTLGTLIHTNLAEYFPIDLSNHSVAHSVLEKVTGGENAGSYRVMIMAAERAMIDGYEKLASACGLQLLQVDYVGNSIYQTMKMDMNHESLMVLKVEEKQTIITIIDHQNMMLQRSINYGIGDTFQEIVNQEAFGIYTYDEALKVAAKKSALRVSLDGSQVHRGGVNEYFDEATWDDTDDIVLAKKAVTRTLAPMINSIARVQDFYQSRNNGATIGRVFITGMGGNLAGFGRLLTNELGIKSTIIKNLEGIGWFSTSADADFFNYIACIGACLHPIDFYNAAGKKAKAALNVNYGLVAAVLAVAGISVAIGLAIPKVNEVKELEAKQAELKEKEVLYEAAEKTYKQYVAVKDFYQALNEGDLLIENPNDNILKFFEELEKTLPASIYISGFSSNSTACTISLRVEGKETAAVLIEKIRKFSSLSNVSVQSFTIKQTDLLDEEGEVIEGGEGMGPEYAEFTLNCVYFPVNFVGETAK